MFSVSRVVARRACPITRPLFNVVPRQQRFRTSSYRSASSTIQNPDGETTKAKLVTAPARKDLEEPDQVPLEGEIQLDITPRAAEQLCSISTHEKDSGIALRIAVESGGCHGYQYKMELTSERAPDDYVFSHPYLTPSNVLIDAVSLSLLKGSTLDFATELIGSSFRILNNPQAKGAGCGCGVSWEANV